MTLLYLKAFHIIFMVTWFAGLFYLPRLFVYHAMAAEDEAGCARFQVMERKLFWGIMTPGGVLTVASGLVMAIGFQDHGPWLHPKVALVALLVAYHAWCGVLVKRFAQARNRHSHVWYRWFNEFPVLILIPVVILAVVKPL
jgi:putative membrane protein